VPIAGFVSGKGRVHHREFVQGTGELTADEFAAFLGESLGVLQRSATDAALIYVCMDWRHIFDLLAAGRQCKLELFNLCVWAKTNAGMGSLYRSQHELICVFKAGASNHINNVELGRHGRNRSNLWTYRGLNSFGADRNELLTSHPTVKPVLMIADAIRDVFSVTSRVRENPNNRGLSWEKLRTSRQRLRPETHLFSICLSAWKFAHQPSAKIMVVTYAEQLAENIASAIRGILVSDSVVPLGRECPVERAGRMR
jgi:hypothetical protein